MTEADQIFDGVAKISSLVLLRDLYRMKLDQIKSVQDKKCGNCQFWMTNHCKPEKVQNLFKSMSSFACSDFQISASSNDLAFKFKAELDVLEVKLLSLK